MSLPFYTDPVSKRELNFCNGYLRLLYFCFTLTDKATLFQEITFFGKYHHVHLIYQVSKIGGLDLEKNRIKPGKGRFLVYFKKSKHIVFDLDHKRLVAVGYYKIGKISLLNIAQKIS